MTDDPSLDIFVCTAERLDPEEGSPVSVGGIGYQWAIKFASSIELDETSEQALEQALSLRDTSGGMVRTVTVSEPKADGVPLFGVARGADAAIHAVAEGYVEEKLEWSATATAVALADVIDSYDFDLVLTGAQSGTRRAGYIGHGIAARLALPCVSLVTDISLTDENSLRVRREVTGGAEQILEVPIPAVLTVYAANRNPYTTTSKIMRARKQADEKIREVEVDVRSRPDEQGSLVTPQEGTRRTELLEGPPEEVAEDLVSRLHTDEALR